MLKITGSVKRSLPWGFKLFLRKIFFFGNKYFCNVCRSHIRKFMPGGTNLPLFDELQIVGGGFHKHDSCPVCLASYRQRSIMLYFENLDHPYRKGDILHLAPEISLFHRIRRKNKGKFITGDIDPARYNYYAEPVYTDLTRLPFDNESFDLILCNHILEHIPDDKKAMTELFRVLKPGGKAIVQVPMSLKLKKTYEDPAITSEAGRLLCFGQKDHVRVYGMDYIDRLKNAGFTVEIFDPMQYRHRPYFNKLMLDENEKVIIACKDERTISSIKHTIL